MDDGCVVLELKYSNCWGTGFQHVKVNLVNLTLNISQWTNRNCFTDADGSRFLSWLYLSSSGSGRGSVSAAQNQEVGEGYQRVWSGWVTQFHLSVCKNTTAAHHQTSSCLLTCKPSKANPLRLFNFYCTNWKLQRRNMKVLLNHVKPSLHRLCCLMVQKWNNRVNLKTINERRLFTCRHAE